MGRAQGLKQCAVPLSLTLAAMLLAWRPCAFALNPALDVSQYAHTSWKIRDGFPKGQIISIAQTPDGYLWLGTEFGLVRFDGVRNVPWQPPPDQALPSSDIFSLLAARDGTLWMGTAKGLASWKDGKLTQYAELAGYFVFKVLEDHEGAVWASGVSVSTGKLCAIHGGSIQCYGDEGVLGRGAFNLYEDSKGNLWVGVKDGLWRWKPGPPKFYPLAGEPDGIQALGEDADGTLLVGWNGGIHRFVDGETEPYPLQAAASQFRARRILRDRDGGLWIGTGDRGLVHAHQGRTDVFTEPGLSGEDIYTFFEDREGSIWVTTVGGLDRFRDFAVGTLTANEGLSRASVGSVLAARNGSVWLATRGGLNRWKDGRITVPRTGSGKPDGKLNGLNPHSLFQDDRGRIWVSTLSAFGYLENDRFTSTSIVPGGAVTSITQDRTGNLWVADERLGLTRLSPQMEVERIPWARLGHKDHASVLAADPSQGGLWIGFFLGGIAYFTDGQIRASYGAANGLSQTRVSDLRFDHDGTLWIAAEGGLSRLKNGRLVTLTSKNGLPCDAVHWAMEDDAHSFWLYTACGLVRIGRPELDGLAAAVERDKDTKQNLQATVFDISDGVRSLSSGGHFSPQVAKSSDGKLWFLPWDGVSVVDPRHLPFNKLPPPVHIEQFIADHKTYDVASAGSGRLRLPPRVRDLQIDYTALSLAAPDKVRFRYLLEGWDRDWQEVGNRRQAFYNDLPPRNYRFRVMACNNSGVWNEAGTSLEFTVEPAYYQTAWFRLSCVAAFLALLWMLYRLRVRQLLRQFNVRLEERVAERTRIARDFHDTLLQSFQGVLLKFHAVSYLIADRPAEAQKTLETVVEQARRAITEGRDAVQGLRSSTVISNDLARAISTFGEGFADPAGRNYSDFRVHVEGTSRDLAPLVREEVYRIACEALRNAFRHAQAERIEVEIHYERRQLRLRVRDNGKGIDRKVLDEGGRPGHHGLPGMRERAKLVGGRLSVSSELGSGTEAEVTIPASFAYSKSTVAGPSMASG
jgi:signal transduction histidine kinase/ligand-binding sensor domain-containing protein